jgi:hypothetical protein
MSSMLSAPAIVPAGQAGNRQPGVYPAPVADPDMLVHWGSQGPAAGRRNRGAHLAAPLTPALGDAEALSESPPSAEERAALDALAEFHATGAGYFVEQATRPETIGCALLDSPIALAAWMIDHDTDSYQKIARGIVDG